MSEPKHTPGPWVSVCSDDCHFYNDTKISSYSVSTEKTRAQLKEDGFDHYRSDPHNVANVDIVSCQFWGDMSPEEAKANAHLIAAAPEMLELLEDMVIDINRGLGPDIYDEYYSDIVDAIAKAKGENQ